MALPHAAGDELAVLRAEVEHEDGVVAAASSMCAHDLVGAVFGSGHFGHAVILSSPVVRCWRVVPGRGGGHPIPTSCSFCSFLPSVMSAGATMTSAFWNDWMVS